MMNKLYNTCLITTLITIMGCANIVPNTYIPKSKNKLTPTQKINAFKKETEKVQLENAISHNKIFTKNNQFVKVDLNNSKVKFWIKYYTTRGKPGFQRFIKNGERYRTVVENIFSKHGLPHSLYYVGLIESGYINRAKSHAGAVGPWQFMKGTARRYGLKVTSSIDERKNIYKSTQAAALYFQDLYNIFGSWELALAAYNAGEYGIIRRIRGANTRSYYELSSKRIIPKETRHYVPKLIAAMHVYQNPDKYALKVKRRKNSRYVSTKAINIKNSTSLKKLANKLKVNVSTIKDLNRDIKRGYIPYLGKRGFNLYVPSKNYKYSKNIVYKSRKIAKVTPKRSRQSYTTKTHIVRRNESLFSISKRYNVTLKTLRKLNRIDNNIIYPGQKINLPTGTNTHVVKTYTIKSGDNLSNIANTFETSIRELKRLNDLRRSKIYVGQKLKIPPHRKKLYTVKKGDALISIANRNKVSLNELKNINGLRNSRIFAGQKLIIELSKI